MLSYVSSFFTSPRKPTSTIEEIPIPGARLNFLTVDEQTLRRVRGEVRTAIAKLTLYQRRKQELEAQIKSLESSIDAAADAHVESLEPLQAELESITTKQMAEITSQQSADPALDTRRQELLLQLAERNGGLDSRAEATRRLLATLNDELQRLLMVIARASILPAMLSTTASPALQVRLNTAQSGVKWTKARFQDAKKGLADCEASIKIDREINKRTADDPNLRLAERHLAEWQSELAAAQAAHDAANAEVATIKQLILND